MTFQRGETLLHILVSSPGASSSPSSLAITSSPAIAHCPTQLATLKTSLSYIVASSWKEAKVASVRL